MSELQLALVGLGILLVVGVWAFNAWQERGHRKRAAAMLPEKAPDVLMAGQGDTETDLGESAAPREPTLANDAPAQRQAVSVAGTARPEFVRQDLPLPGEWTDGRADCLLRIEFVDAIPVASLWKEHGRWSGQIDKPLQWFGLDENGGRWRSLLPHDPGAVTQLAVALQLVDRSGALGAEMLDSFLQGMRQLAQRFSGLIELPDPGPILTRARELDVFCAAVDLQLILQVLPRRGSLTELVGAKLKPVFEATGLRREGERFVAATPEGVEMFSVTCLATKGGGGASLDQAGLTGLAFSLDVPRVADGKSAFERMLACARQSADAVGGEVTDAQRNPLGEGTVAAILQRVGELQAKMARVEIPAGSVRALRLFS